MRHLLNSCMRIGDIVEMDNIGSHKSKAVREAIGSIGVRRLFLPTPLI